MSAERPLNVVLCWHMHQPQYKNLTSGEYQLPWTYLHATKDYVDMAALLERNPGARAVVNFAPILLEQLSDYAQEIRDALTRGAAIRDPLLAALANPALPVRADERIILIDQCLRANEARLINRFAPYRLLADMAGVMSKNTDYLRYLDEQYLFDILVWYHIAWMGETVHRGDDRIKRLIAKGSGFSFHDRRQLLEIIGELLGSVIGRYRTLAERGQVELSMNPYAHPITPLLLNMQCAREAMTGVHLPSVDGYTDGEARARWHVERGLEVFREHFGHRPRGCWPAEGGLSTAMMAVLDAYDFHWTASGEDVLRNSLEYLGRSEEIKTAHGLYKPYRVGDATPACFFRDDGLSDLIGFTYADWHGDDAAADLVQHLENIAAACHDRSNQVVSVIMDGENAWEHYPNNGYYFLNALYQKLTAHPDLELTTFSDCLDRGIGVDHLSSLVAGSWVYGTFSTWIGDLDKNRAWEMLVDAKRAFDAAVRSGRLDDTQRFEAERQLAVCEGSDWFWWFGDYNPEETVSDFERLFRMHLSNLYQMLGVEPPEYLSHVMAHGGGRPEHGGTMRRGHQGS